MSANYQHARSYLDRLLRDHSLEELRQRLAPSFDNPSPKVPGGCRPNMENLQQRWQLLRVSPGSRESLADSETLAQLERYRNHIENFIGSVKLPVGLAGPVRVNGLFAHGDYYIPLASTEAALVASYHRGAQLISEAGGCTAMLLNEGVNRAPGFSFRNLRQVGLFVAWSLSEVETFQRVADATTRHGKLVDMSVVVEGNHVYLMFEFTTGDAAGQNMVTIATEAICAHIKANSPVRPEYSFIEANLSGDKKASAQSFLKVRGRKVSAEVILPPDLVEKRLRTTVRQVADYWRMGAVGSVLSGAIGAQGHYANGLAALYIACGQDVACVAESATGVTRFELTAKGDLYAAVTLPNLMVGTVGGGTTLPSQSACLEIMDLAGPGKANALAEVCAALCLAGELSITGAICAQEFARAHQCLARGNRPRSEAGESIRGCRRKRAESNEGHSDSESAI
ncbi:MAG: hydroxymethylglutaryl-CoA reductase [Deltaproteobacteria bacterium]|nr:hydroxymethylglutaryl-CoA reductase [Deltaproteobacteria bacterium]